MEKTGLSLEQRAILVDRLGPDGVRYFEQIQDDKVSLNFLATQVIPEIDAITRLKNDILSRAEICRPPLRELILLMIHRLLVEVVENDLKNIRKRVSGV